MPAGGSRRAAADALEEYRHIIRGEVARTLRRARTAQLEADDLGQVASMALLDARAIFNPLRGVPFAPFARRTIRHRLIDELRRLDPINRKHRRHVQAGLDAFYEVPIEAATHVPAPVHDDDAILSRRLWRAVAQLPPQQRRLIRLVYRAGYEQKEAGVMMGVSEGRASQVHKAAIAGLIVLLASGRTMAPCGSSVASGIGS